LLPASPSKGRLRGWKAINVIGSVWKSRQFVHLPTLAIQLHLLPLKISHPIGHPSLIRPQPLQYIRPSILTGLIACIQDDTVAIRQEFHIV
jgi:hypothetical protein